VTQRCVLSAPVVPAVVYTLGVHHDEPSRSAISLNPV
jgi:hypothetical protein